MPSIFRTLALTALALASVKAQLTTEQKAIDFQTLASLYAKRYAPANWKVQALGVNPLDIRSWMERVRQTKSDLDFYEVMLEYTASFQDGHTTYIPPTNFTADLGLFVDLYDNKLLIEEVDRTRYPAANFPFGRGDELVSIDGQSVEDIMRNILRFRREGTERASRRFAADWVVHRNQSVFPRAVELPDASDVVIRRASGELETFRLTWLKTGLPLVSMPPTLAPITASRKALSAKTSQPDPMAALKEFERFGVSEEDLALHDRSISAEDGSEVSRRTIMGLAARTPYFDLPSNFVLRRGGAVSDSFHSGSFEAGGRKIGYIRIMRFSPANPAAAVAEFASEIQFFQANTDGLIVDVTRNTGGGCISFDYLSYLIPAPFTTFRQVMPAYQEDLVAYSNMARLARQNNSPSWVIDTYEYLYNAILSATKERRALTGPVATPCGSLTWPAPTEIGFPARDSGGNMLAYTKPVILLADELSASMGDMFAAMFQDNKRGPVVGIRTDGRGGQSGGPYAAGFFSEGTATTTRALVVRQQVASQPGLPSAPYIENLGVEPDIALDYMTRENLMLRGKPFVDRFTEIMLSEIAKAR